MRRRVPKEILRELNGFISVIKPSGVTSMQVVEYLKRSLGWKVKLGHCGTLDSLAAGVLPIAIGKATKLIPFLDDTKEYVIEILFGMRTDTDDLDGRVLEREEVGLTPEQLANSIRNILTRFTGAIDQVPPTYSAKKIYGYRAYELARSGYTVELKPKRVRIDTLQLLSVKPEPLPRALMYVKCSRGTYMRALARDIGEALGIPSTLSFITRISAFGFKLEDSIVLEDLEPLSSEERAQLILRQLTQPVDALNHLSTAVLRDDAIFKVKNGSNFTRRHTITVFDNNNRLFRVTDKAGNLIAIASSENGRTFKIERVY